MTQNLFIDGIHMTGTSYRMPQQRFTDAPATQLTEAPAPETVSDTVALAEPDDSTGQCHLSPKRLLACLLS